MKKTGTARHITWYMRFGLTPSLKLPRYARQLRIHQNRYTQLTPNIGIGNGRSRILKTANACEIPFPDSYFDAIGLFCLCVAKI